MLRRLFPGVMALCPPVRLLNEVRIDGIVVLGIDGQDAHSVLSFKLHGTASSYLIERSTPVSRSRIELSRGLSCLENYPRRAPNTQTPRRPLYARPDV